MDFTFDPSLVLYLPLYQLDGASFMSKDAYGRLCTVTGALWRPNGTYFDGINDKIQISTGLWATHSMGTIMGWILPTSSSKVLSSADTATDTRYFDFTVTSNKVRITQRNNDVADQVETAAVLTTTEFHHIALTSNGTAYRLFVNGVEYSPSVVAGANNGDWFADTANRDNVVIGAMVRTAPTYKEGTVGELLVYSRPLTPQEIQHNYLATKWRYR